MSEGISKSVHKGGGQASPVKDPKADSFPWLEIVRAIPPLLWAILALVVVFGIGPDITRLVKIGAVTKIGIGTLDLELAQKRLAEVKGLDEAGIPENVRDQLKRRFAYVADTANEAQILWVDDKHPQQNVLLRRVLASLSIPIELAKSTDEALQWLDHANYNIVITDLTREHDVSSPCDGASSAPTNAGCDLIKKIESNGYGHPMMIVYAKKIDGVASRENLHVINNPGDLLNAVLDGIERINRKK
jgi:hypothetical protein